LKRRVFFFTKKYCTAENIRTFVLVLLAIVVLVEKYESPLALIKKMGNSELIASLLIIVACTVIVRIVSYIVAYFTEDAAKVDPDPKHIMKTYPLCEMLVEDGDRYPINMLWVKDDPEQKIEYKIEDHPNDFYKLPTQIDKHFADIINSAHKISNTYNQINIRLNDFDFEPNTNTITLNTERTMYYDLLVTNRAMDIIWDNGFSVRNLYEPGPFLSDLKDSRLANHIGYNGIVETSDGMIVMVYRNAHVSTDKNQYKFSISGSLKTRHVLDSKSHTITSINQFCNAVTHEIIDELNIDLEAFPNAKDKISFTKDDIIAFYRDMCEGGKPHFLFYKKIDFTMKQIDAGLQRISRGKNKDFTVDGKRFIWLTHEEFVNSKVGEADKKGKVNLLAGKKSLVMNCNNAGLTLVVRDFVRK